MRCSRSSIVEPFDKSLVIDQGSYLVHSAHLLVPLHSTWCGFNPRCCLRTSNTIDWLRLWRAHRDILIQKDASKVTIKPDHERRIKRDIHPTRNSHTMMHSLHDAAIQTQGANLSWFATPVVACKPKQGYRSSRPLRFLHAGLAVPMGCT